MGEDGPWAGASVSYWHISSFYTGRQIPVSLWPYSLGSATNIACQRHCLPLSKIRLIIGGVDGWGKIAVYLASPGVQLIVAYRPAIFAAGKGKGGMFLFLFLHFHSFSSFSQSFSFISPLLSLFFSLADDKMTHKGWHVVKLQHN